MSNVKADTRRIEQGYGRLLAELRSDPHVIATKALFGERTHVPGPALDPQAPAHEVPAQGRQLVGPYLGARGQAAPSAEPSVNSYPTTYTRERPGASHNRDGNSR